MLEKSDRKNMPRKRTLYGAFSEEQKDQLRKNAREAYTRKDALVKKSITNEQMSAHPIASTLEEPSIHHNVAPNIENNIGKYYSWIFNGNFLIPYD
jgi:hypothetical protein